MGLFVLTGVLTYHTVLLLLQLACPTYLTKMLVSDEPAESGFGLDTTQSYAMVLPCVWRVEDET